MNPEIAAKPKNLTQLGLTSSELSAAHPGWRLLAFQSAECLSYLASHEVSREAVLIDPSRDLLGAYREAIRGFSGYRWLGVFDTHTHADHVSAAPELSREFSAHYGMSAASPCSRVTLRLGPAAADTAALSTTIMSASSPLTFLATPGHAPDAMVIIWGPFAFTGDTILIGDVGRSDLPGGDPCVHYASLQVLKKAMNPSLLVLPGHDALGARASTWARELAANPSLGQSEPDFIREAREFVARAPARLVESLRENTR